MRCNKAEHLLSLFLDDQLSKRKASKVKAHLEACSVCSKELNYLKESWDLLKEYKSISPSPDFKAKFWQRVSQEEAVVERKPVFVFPKLLPRLVPVLAILAIILIISIYIPNPFLNQDIQQLTLMTKDEDILMIKELDLAEELDIIQNTHVLEEMDIIDSIEL